MLTEESVNSDGETATQRPGQQEEAAEGGGPHGGKLGHLLGEAVLSPLEGLGHTGPVGGGVSRAPRGVLSTCDWNTTFMLASKQPWFPGNSLPSDFLALPYSEAGSAGARFPLHPTLLWPGPERDISLVFLECPATVCQPANLRVRFSPEIN